MIRTARLSLIITALAASLGHNVTAKEANRRDICSWSPYGSTLLYHQPRTCPVPIDDTAASRIGDWSPWSYLPYCVKPRNKPRSSPPYCVFSSDHYRAGHGLSVITTPQLAASIADTLDDGTVPPPIRNHPSSFLAHSSGPGPAFEIKDLPGRGKGAVATRKIRQWEVAMVAYPAVIAQMDLWEALGPDQIRAVLRQAIQQLPSEQQGVVLSLDHSTGGALVQDILNTNIFGIELDGVMHMGLYPESSRLNHNCRPNAFWRYSKDNLAMEVVAIRAIEVGEEITHSYAPLGLNYKDRRETLKEWGFTCKCPLCSSSRRVIQQSDQRRNRIREVRAVLAEREDLSGDQVDKLAGELLRLIGEEKLEVQLVVYYEVIARAYMGAFDFEKAKEYANMCENAWIQYGGLDHDNVEGMKQLWRDLDEML
ncbi:SET domain-containing protein [Coniochaeta ligniaria NRRL 30616]|uniref:SET domain-containing protein n=1 Tax=Coniochaeta ligniaria NRRL 30616 TaxID=1408157 RepID=A0A1J7JVY7_9PEZI|nr:SET domain-containing protein [Coniochaeta ligniaria NRRL 30616]